MLCYPRRVRPACEVSSDDELAVGCFDGGGRGEGEGVDGGGVRAEEDGDGGGVRLMGGGRAGDKGGQSELVEISVMTRQKGLATEVLLARGPAEAPSPARRAVPAAKRDVDRCMSAVMGVRGRREHPC